MKPLFDSQPVYSIGSLTIDPSNPNVIWVGTGESRWKTCGIWNSVYKSMDGGNHGKIWV